MDRIKEIQIDNMEVMEDNYSYSDIVKGRKKNEYKNLQEKEVDSDDEMVKTDNKSWQSNDSLDSITELSQKSVQTKVILEMQEMMKQMKEEQQLMRDYIRDLENTIIILADENEEIESYKSAEEKAKKLKKKRKIDEAKLKGKKHNPKDNVERRRSQRLIKPKLSVSNAEEKQQTKQKVLKIADIKEKEKVMDIDMQQNDRN